MAERIAAIEAEHQRGTAQLTATLAAELTAEQERGAAHVATLREAKRAALATAEKYRIAAAQAGEQLAAAQARLATVLAERGNPATQPPTRTRSTPSHRTPAPDSSAAKVAKLRAKDPDITQGEVAEKTGLSVRTVARHWKDTAPDSRPATAPDSVPDSQPATAPANGHATPDLLPASTT